MPDKERKERGGSSGSSVSDLSFLFIFILILAVLWWVNGGNNRPLFGGDRNKVTGPGVPSSDESIGYPLASTNARQSSLSPTDRLSGLRGQERFTLGVGSANRSLFASREQYLTLSASSRNSRAVNVSSWRLQGLFSYAYLGTGLELYELATNHPLQPIYLKPGDGAVISSGKSPVGLSFRLNKCSGYLEQFKNFYPPLRLECPRPTDEINRSDLYQQTNNCIDYVSGLPRCQFPTSTPPSVLGRTCRDYIYTQVLPTLGYQNCVTRHKTDKDFYRPSWRIFLGSDRVLWRDEKEIIKLLDGAGGVVGVLDY